MGTGLSAHYPGEMEILLIVGVAVALTESAVLATSIYLHRALAHRSLTIHPVAAIVFRTILWLTTGQSRQEWVAVHRKHHAFTDCAGDPHSPRLLGFWRVQLFNVYYYIAACRDRASIAKYAPDLAPDRLDRVLFSRGLLGLAVGLAALCVLMGPGPGLLAGGLHAALYVMGVAPAINALGHWRGGRNYENSARNSTVLAWVTGGESLHNNHHANPRAPRFSVRWWEFDPSWPLIRALAASRLLTIAGTPVRLAGARSFPGSEPSAIAD
jgi:stearoyl-CoA desaturase (delta-9 desaturase)